MSMKVTTKYITVDLKYQGHTLFSNKYYFQGQQPYLDDLYLFLMVPRLRLC